MIINHGKTMKHRFLPGLRLQGKFEIIPFLKKLKLLMRKNLKDLVRKNEEGRGPTGKIPESGILQRKEAESAHSSSSSNPSNTREKTPLLLTSKPRFKRFVCHFWGNRRDHMRVS